ncbi:MAG: hypothetical protein DI630_31840 [Gordonia sp. (in: high G+C Gram-positive bacteria)]|nr:MAG: hypothetical protein DI630_31840 [Gordonia sp. (in: high G+C Gram-positive bacteria)]
MRLQAFAIDESILTQYFDRIEVPIIPSGTVKILEGDYGAGKSEIAEQWHRQAIKDLEQTGCGLPIWLDSRELAVNDLETTLNQKSGKGWRNGRNATIVIDGLDEIDPASASNILKTARTLSRAVTDLKILVTSRPGIEDVHESERVGVTPLTEEESLALIEASGGSSLKSYGWSVEMRESIQRPFFALAAGVMLGEEETVGGEADLIRGLVERALARGTESAAITSSDTYRVLKDLAVRLVRDPGGTHHFSDLLVARGSRLVTTTRDGQVHFSLPIFQQWFGAQAILDESIDASEVVRDSPSFHRWRWAAAVAALSAPSADDADHLLRSWVKGNAGAAAWIINEAFGSARTRQNESAYIDNVEELGVRILSALREWEGSLGPLADGLLPEPLLAGPVDLGVIARDRRLGLGFSMDHPACDNVTPLPEGSFHIPGTQNKGWAMWIFNVEPSGVAWPWIFSLGIVSKAMLRKLSIDPNLGSPGGIWSQESRYSLARDLTRRGNLDWSDIPIEEVKKSLVRFVEVDGDEMRVRAVPSWLGDRAVDRIADLFAWATENPHAEASSMLPEKDLSPTDGGWVWDQYSDRRLMEFEVEVFDRACEAYDEALAHSFSKLGWSMRSSALAPFGVLLELRHDDDHSMGRYPSLTVVRVPMDLLKQFVLPDANSVWSTSGRAVISSAQRAQAIPEEFISEIDSRVQAWMGAQGFLLTGGLGWEYMGADHMANARPASEVAANWLWKDLKQLGLGVGTYPRLR